MEKKLLAMEKKLLAAENFLLGFYEFLLAIHENPKAEWNYFIKSRKKVPR